MTYALVTGGLGLIGSFITRHLLENKIVDKVVCLDHFGRYVNFTKFNVVDYRKLRLAGIEDRVIIERGEAKFYSVMFNIINKYRPVYIFHLAALPLAKLDNLNVEEAMEGAVISTTNIFSIINLISDYQPKKVVYTSSSMIYGDFQTEIATEEHPQNPKEIYGIMKLAGEVVTNGLGRFYKIPYTIIRPSAVYGPTDMNFRVSQIFIEKALRGEEIIINGEDEKLDFSYVKDVAKGFVLAATCDQANGETFNITYGQARTLLDFVKCLKVYFPDIKYKIEPRDDFRPKRGTLSIEKARRILNYQPEYPIERGIAEYVEFVKKYHPDIHTNKY